ncbi:MAG: sulfotransferase domain-containing protein [Bacteroidales bacterium]|nr:sulfotransferase domain-containing protein [Bacteroidales bacterium]MCF8337878.1 sulfotransferase domain-containing protein [Bacteroidales bacterium]
MIIYYSVLLVSFFLIALIFRIKRFVFYALAENSVALVDKLLSDNEDEAKIKAIQEYNKKLVNSLVKMLLVGVLAFVCGSIPILIYLLISQTDFISLDFSSFSSILSISIGATVAFVIPFSGKKNSDYSELSKLLHRMALNNYNISYKLFKQETKKISRKNLHRKSNFVIISGLARAGTTSLMNDLSKIEDFVSLSYANMPFLMCPNFWAKIHHPKEKKLKERSHKDGIMIGLNSNEALEEYFFKVKAEDSYIKDYHLKEYNISQSDYTDYLDYQSILKLDNSKIYLAKNNNFLLRYNSLREFNDDFVMVILYRDPLTHAASLLEKHRDYAKLQKEDPFVLEYMNWLGHHEFGLNQKLFLFNDSDENFFEDKESMDFWLKTWINYYKYVLKINHPNTIFINYESYCQNPEKTIEIILKKTGITTTIPAYKAFRNTRKPNEEFSSSLYEEAQEIYHQLKKQ